MALPVLKPPPFALPIFGWCYCVRYATRNFSLSQP